MQTLAEQLISFYTRLTPPPVPRGFEVLHPQPAEEVRTVVQQFFRKFYNDSNPRRLLLGINPGRFGAGITGVNFTAPRQLKQYCGIDHPWNNGSELSAEFIYKMIESYGGTQKFYGDFFIGAVSPLGYIKDGKNINYYDDKKLAKSVSGFVKSTIEQQLEMGFVTDVCFCIGGEKNFKYLDQLNSEFKFFKKIVPLAHPRFIMQYRRKKIDEFIELYLNALQRA